MAGANKANASQFFVVLAVHADYLDGKHTIFGEVAEGLDVLEKINEVLVDEQGRPLKNIRIKHTVILDDPFEDPPELEVPDKSPVPVRDQFDLERIADDEDLNDPNEGKTEEQINEEIRVAEAKSRAVVLEMLNDLPDADVKPPDNVLFVCKLNPVTRDEDLELIFCRFGGIKSCEIIRDWKTGDSLQYAFIEFETAQMCEQAHLKMETVLIDDRRIHVDFSQSVSKLWNSWRRGDRDLTNQPIPSDSGRRLELKEQRQANSFDYVHAGGGGGKRGGLMVKQENNKALEEGGRKSERDKPRGIGRDDDHHKEPKRSRRT
jgi:peptidyl-prolyl cis-trans isomerase-like 4